MQTDPNLILATPAQDLQTDIPDPDRTLLERLEREAKVGAFNKYVSAFATSATLALLILATAHFARHQLLPREAYSAIAAIILPTWTAYFIAEIRVSSVVKKLYEHAINCPQKRLGRRHAETTASSEKGTS